MDNHACSLRMWYEILYFTTHPNYTSGITVSPDGRVPDLCLSGCVKTTSSLTHKSEIKKALYVTYTTTISWFLSVSIIIFQLKSLSSSRMNLRQIYTHSFRFFGWNSCFKLQIYPGGLYNVLLFPSSPRYVTWCVIDTFRNRRKEYFNFSFHKI